MNTNPGSTRQEHKGRSAIGERFREKSARRRIAWGSELYAGIKHARAQAFATLKAQADTNEAPKESGQ